MASLLHNHMPTRFKSHHTWRAVAGLLLVIGVALASLTGNLHGNLMTTPHLLRAMAERGQLPGWFGRLSPRFGTPANALWVFVAASLLLALSGGFVVLAVLGVVARLPAGHVYRVKFHFTALVQSVRITHSPTS